MSFAEFKVVAWLTWRHARRHPGRVLLTAGSTIAAACIVVWVVSGYDALASQFEEFEEGYIGPYQLLVVPPAAEGFGRVALPAAVVQELQADPRTAAAVPIYQARARIRPEVEPSPDAPASPDEFSPRGRAFGGSPGRMMRGGGFGFGPQLVGADAPAPPHPLRDGRWLEPDDAGLPVGVLTSETADRFHVEVGDSVWVGPFGQSGECEILIAGIVEQPKRLPGPSFRVGLPPSRAQALSRGPASSALYVTRKTAEAITGQDAEAHFIGLSLQAGVEPQQFKAEWAERLAALAPGAEMQTVGDVRQEIHQSTTFEGVRGQAYAATGIALLASLFIIFTTLSMGVHERIRQFAMLRAIGLTKAQIALSLTLESLGLGAIGWGGGLLAGWGLLQVLRAWHPELLERDALLGAWCLFLSAACAFGGAGVASLFPAWKATRIRPLDAMVVHPHARAARFPCAWTAAGLLLVVVNPLLVFFVPMPDAARYLASTAIGCVSMAVGFLLLAPAVILAAEKLLGPALARLLRLHPSLLAAQLSTNLWRSLGIVASLTLGLGLFVAMQTWGYSMLGPFTPGDWAPDLIVRLPRGVPEENLAQVEHVPGVVPEQCAPLAVEQVKFAEDVTGAKIRATAARQDNCVMVGVDAARTLGGDDPLFAFRFVEGDRDAALRKLQQGRFCLVPDHFQRESGLGVGDRFAVLPPRDPQHPVKYEIAGVVSMDGWHWLSKVGLRNRGGGRSAGLMFAPREQVRRDFNLDRTSFFWMNLDGTAAEEEVKAELARLAANQPADAAAPRGRGGPPAGRPFAFGARSGVESRSRESVRQEIGERASGIIWALCQLPLITLAVTALGVVNTVAASVRARRWEMGVLRALGASRGSLFRLILAEALLIGLAACLLSLAFGVLSGYCGVGVTRYVNVRGGLVTPLVIPWAQIAIGFGITLALCFLAAFGPALSTACRDPLSLLQSGRAAA